jgi:hypothetical protein
MHRSELYFLQIGILWLERSIVIVHESLCLHFSDFVVKWVNCALWTAASQGFFILCQAVILIQVMVIICTTVMESGYQTDYGASLLFWVNISAAVRSRVKYAPILFNARGFCFVDIDGSNGTFTVILKAKTVAERSIVLTDVVLIELTEWRVHPTHTKSHISINSPLVHLFMIERLLENGGKWF